MTAGRLLDYLGTLRGLRPATWRPLAERLDLDPTVPIKKLSRGNRQKVGVIQVFMGTEPLLVMDEPTTGLDPLMQREFLALVGEARAAGRTIFLSSHNLPEVERTCDRIGIIREGRLVDITTVQDLLGSHWRSINIVLNGTPPPLAFWEMENARTVSFAGGDVHLMVRGDVNAVLRRLAQVDVRDVAITTPEIEDVFYRFYDDHEPGGDGPGSHEVAAALSDRAGAIEAPGSPVPEEVLR
jgi:ABC-2 type transport system ATP-binding protein